MSPFILFPPSFQQRVRLDQHHTDDLVARIRDLAARPDLTGDRLLSRLAEPLLAALRRGATIQPTARHWAALPMAIQQALPDALLIAYRTWLTDCDKPAWIGSWVEDSYLAELDHNHFEDFLLEYETALRWHLTVPDWYKIPTIVWAALGPAERRDQWGTYCEYFNFPVRHLDVDGSRYMIIRLLGVGSLGIVYAVQGPQGTYHAAKIVRPDLQTTHKYLRAQFSERLEDAPHRAVAGIVPFHGVGHSNDLGPVALMGLADDYGRTLEDVLARPDHHSAFFQRVVRVSAGARSFLESARGRAPRVGDTHLAVVLARVAEALHRLHHLAEPSSGASGWLHCDVKPSNILLSARQGVLLGDLESSQQRDAATGEAFRGTPGYAPPEQRDGKALLPASDVYSLGAVLYRAILGSPIPTALPGRAHAIRRLCKEAGAHPDLAAICARALDEDPRRRYQSALDMADDLWRFAAGRPVRGSHGPLLFLLRDCLHDAVRNAAMWALAGAVLLAAAGWYRVKWLQQETIPGVLAAQRRWRHPTQIREPTTFSVRTLPEPILLPNVRFMRVSLLWDLSQWRLLPRSHDPSSAGRLVPALVTRVLQVQKTGPAAAPAHVTWRVSTTGYDLDLMCSTHPAIVFRLQPRADLGGRLVRVKQLWIDLSHERPGAIITVVTHGTVWNGFQPLDDGYQWVALLAPADGIPVEIGVIFPRALAGGPEVFKAVAYPEQGQNDGLAFYSPWKAQELELHNTAVTWRPRHVRKGFVYELRFPWPPD